MLNPGQSFLPYVRTGSFYFEEILDIQVARARDVSIVFVIDIDLCLSNLNSLG